MSRQRNILSIHLNQINSRAKYVDNEDRSGSPLHTNAMTDSSCMILKISSKQMFEQMQKCMTLGPRWGRRDVDGSGFLLCFTQ